MEVLGKASIDIRADDSNFEKDLRKAANKIKDIKVNVSADVSLTGVNKKLQDFRNREQKKNLKLKVSLELADADKAIQSVQRKLNFKKYRAVVNAHLDTELLWEQAEEFRDYWQNTPIVFKAQMDTASAIRQMETFQAIAENNDVEVDADVATAGAEAELAVLTRSRRVNIIANILGERVAGDFEQILKTNSVKAFRIFTGGGNPLVNFFRDPEIAKAIEGFSIATAGVIDPRKIKTTMSNLLGDFEGVAVKAAKAGLAVGTIASGAIAATGAVARLLADISQIAGLAAIVPSGFVAVKSVMESLKMSWAGFSDAMDKDPAKAADAIAKLTPAARSSAWALQGIVQSVTEATETTYWKRMGDAIVTAANATKGPLTDGMRRIATETADHTIQIAKAMENFAKSGGVKEVYDNIALALDNAERGTRQFTEALLTLTREGSKSLPRFGEWISEIATSFNQWITEAAEAGKITSWIDMAVQRLQELGSIVLNTSKIIGLLADAAEQAGIGGLTALAEGFEKTYEAMNKSAAYYRMVDLFRDAGMAVQEIAEGLGNVGGALMDHSNTIGNIMNSVGTTMRTLLDHTANMIANSGMMEGIERFFNEILEASGKLGPSFQNIGDTIGHLAEMFGVLLNNMAPGLNSVTEIVEKMFGALKGGWMDVVPVLNDAFQYLVKALIGPLEALAETAGVVLKAVSLIPSPIIAVGMALTAVTGIVAKFLGAWKGITTVKVLLAGLTNPLKIIPAVLAGVSAAFTALKTVAVVALKAIGVAFKGLASAIIAHPIMAAVALIAGAITGLVLNASENARKYEESVQSFSDAWDPVTQQMDKSSGVIQSTMERISDMKVGKLFGNFEDTLSAIGSSAHELADSLASLDSSQLEKLATEVDDIKSKLSQGGTSFSALKDAVSDETLAVLKISREELDAMSRAEFSQTIGGLSELANEANEGVKNAKTLREELTNIGNVAPPELFEYASAGSQELRDALVNANDLAGTLVGNFETLGSVTSTVEQKISAMQSNMEIMGLDTSSWNGPLRDMFETAQQNTTAFQELKQNMQGLDASKIVTIDDALNGAKHATFEFSNGMGKVSSGLYDIVSTSSDGIKAMATSVYDQAMKGGASTTEAINTAINAVRPQIGSLIGQMRDIGIPDEQIQGILDTFGLIPEDINTALNVEGVDQAISQMLQVEMAALAIQSGDWTMYLKVMDQEARQTLDAFTMGAQSQEEIMVKLGMNKDEFESFMIQLSTSKYPTQVIAEVDTMAPEQKLQALVSYGNSLQAEVRLKTMDIDTAMSKLDGFPELIETQIKAGADVSGSIMQIDSLIAWIEQSSPQITADPEFQNFRAEFDALIAEAEAKGLTTEVDAVVDPALNKIDSVKTQAEVPVTKPITADATQAVTEVGKVEATAAGAKADIPVTTSNPDNGAIINRLVSQAQEGGNFPVLVDMGSIEHMRGVLRHYQNTTINVTAKANLGAIEHMRGVLRTYQNTVINVTARANLGPIEHMRGVLRSYQNTTITVTAKANLGPIEHMRGVLRSYKNTTITVGTKANLSGVNAVKSGMGAIRDKTVNLRVNATTATSGIARVRNLASSVPDKTFKIIANYAQAVAAIVRVMGMRIVDKRFTIHANNGPAMAAIRAVNSARVANKTNTITTYRRTVAINSEGGMYDSLGVQTFANGGFSKAMKSIQMHAFAGGSEKHIAQIARGGYPYRVWAEPETGGEAYIPLAKAKRTRSLKILEQVANHFGLSLMQQFADGGFGGSTYVNPSNGMQSFATGGTTAKLTSAQKKARDKAAAEQKKARDAASARAKKLAEQLNDFMKNLSQALSSFTNNMDGIFGKKKSPVVQAVNEMKSDLYKAVRDSKNVSPARSRAVNDASRAIGRHGGATAGLWHSSGTYGTDALNRGIAANGKFTAYGRKMQFTLRDIEIAQGRLNARLQTATEKLEEQVKLRDQLKESVTSMARGTFSIADATKIAHEAGQPVTAKTLTKSATAVIQKNNILNRRIQEMKKRGFAPAVIAEVAQLGLSEGIATADMLLKSPVADIKALNYAYKRLDETSAVLGNTTANIMYKAGVDSANGIVKGLESQLSKLDKAGLLLSNSLIASFKKALGIKSPSRVMRDEVGSQIVDGLVLGITANIGKVDKARKSLDLAVGASAWGSVGSTNLDLSTGLAPNRGTVVEYNMTINNPVEEKTSETMRKNNQNLSLIGLA